MSAKLSVLLCVFSLLACSAKKTESFAILNSKTSIIGGIKATSTDAITSSTVALITVDAYGIMAYCTGTLVSKNLVLTAAHCLKENQYKPSIFFGEVLPSFDEQSKLLQVSEWVTHPEYGWTYDDNHSAISTHHDIALIKLQSEIPAMAQPVPILDSSVQVKVGDSLLLTGYGLIDDLNYKMAEGLNYVRVPVADLLTNIIVTDQTNARGACNGDSGGPAFLETDKGLVVVGVTRGPHGEVSDCHHYGEYTNATMFKDFILQQAHRLMAEPPQFTTRPFSN